jgi:predicted enzyme related to lactoylglutathione lyase
MRGNLFYWPNFKKTPINRMSKEKRNPGVYFEIPVLNMDRAVRFYSALFSFSFDQEEFDGIQMAYFPFEEKLSGVTGALAKGKIYQPTHQGIVLYLHTEDLEETLRKAENTGAKVLYPATFHKDLGFAVAEIEDSEGNRLGLHQRL